MSSNLQFIKKVRGYSVTSISVTDCFSALYDVYKIVGHTADYNTTGTGVVELHYRLIDSGGNVISDAEYNAARLMTKAEAGYDKDKFENGTYMYGVTAIGDYENAGSIVYIYNPYNSSAYTSMAGIGTAGYNYSSTRFRGVNQIGIHKSAEQITGVQLYCSTSTSVDFTVAVYGVKI